MAREVAGAFAAFGPAYMKWLHAGAQPGGVTFARLKLLNVLLHAGPQIMSGLRDALGITARSVTALVDALEAEGLVRRVAHPRDRRATIIELTEAGRSAVAEQFEAHVQRAESLFGVLGENDQRTLLRLLRTLSDELGEVGGCSPAFPPGLGWRGPVAAADQPGAGADGGGGRGAGGPRRR